MDDANKYMLTLYVDGENVGGYNPTAEHVKKMFPVECRADFSLEISEYGGPGKQYGLTCQTISNNLNKMRNSETVKIGHVPNHEMPMTNNDEHSNSGFEDVQDPSSFFFDPVYWAIENGVTAGVSETQFGVGQTLTRAQAATFMYAYSKEKVKATTQKFTDVAIDRWFAAPIQWMSDGGYTAGYPDGRFGPDDVVTRAQALTFIRAFVKGAGGECSFEDVPKDAWYYKPIAWANASGILNGVPDGTGNANFYPERPCTREVFVSFLFRMDDM